jgi:Mce-associated membrane protein
MGKHDDAALSRLNGTDEEPAGDLLDGQEVPPDRAPGDTTEPNGEKESRAETPTRQRISAVGAAIVFGTAALVAMGSLAGWLGYRSYQAHQVSTERAQLLGAARQGAIDLTTIDYATVDADIKRILDSSTGTFHDDFQKRSGPFVEAVKAAQSKSVGTITEAAVQSQNGDQADVLVTVSMKMTSTAGPETPPQAWRMRINVQKSGDVARMTDVQFVTG